MSKSPILYACSPHCINAGVMTFPKCSNNQLFKAMYVVAIRGFLEVI